jgi:hypothetical protein
VGQKYCCGCFWKTPSATPTDFSFSLLFVLVPIFHGRDLPVACISNKSEALRGLLEALFLGFSGLGKCSPKVPCAKGFDSSL